MLTREDKAREISEISDRFAKAKAAFLVDFKGLDVEKMTQLRKLLRPIQTELRVVKNTLAIRALKDHQGYETALKEHLKGTNAVVFSFEDPSASAKAITGFSKENEALLVKTGAVEGVALNEAQIKFLATLPGKPELRAKLLGTLQAPTQKFVSLLSAVPGSFVRCLAAYKDQKANAS